MRSKPTKDSFRTGPVSKGKHYNDTCGFVPILVNELPYKMIYW